MKLNADLLAAHWPLSHLRYESTLQEYPTRTTYVIKSHEGRFVVKIYEDKSALGLVDPSRDKVNDCLAVFDYLETCRFNHSPMLIHTRNGDRFVRSDGWTIYVMECIEGHLPEQSPNTFAALGTIAAEIKNRFVHYPHPYPISISDTIQELKARAANYDFKADFLKLVDGLVALTTQPVSLIHPEINCANVMQKRDGTMVLLDWDSVGSGPTVLMSGYPLINVFIDEHKPKFNQSWATAFYMAYTAGQRVSDPEKEMIFQAAILHALRYLPFHSTLERWARVQYAVANKDALLSVIP